MLTRHPFFMVHQQVDANQEAWFLGGVGLLASPMSKESRLLLEYVMDSVALCHGCNDAAPITGGPRAKRRHIIHDFAFCPTPHLKDVHARRLFIAYPKCQLCTCGCGGTRTTMAIERRTQYTQVRGNFVDGGHALAGQI